MPALLVAWDFHGVLNTYGNGIGHLLQLVTERGGENIVVSNSTPTQIRQFLAERDLSEYISKIYGMERHHGLVVRHKVAALKGHIQDAGPYDYALMVGDSLDDMADGKEAKVSTCLYDPHHTYDHVEHDGDYVVRDLAEVVELLPI